MLQNFTFESTGRQIATAATFIKYEKVNAGATDDGIQISADGQSLGVWYPGDSVELPNQVTLIQVTPIANAQGVVRAGLGRIISNRMVMTGQIGTTDLSLTKADSGKLFSGVIYPVGVNGVASIKANGATVYIRKIIVTGGNATAISWAWGIGSSPGTASPAGTAAGNKKVGQPASTALLSTGSAIAWPILSAAECPSFVLMGSITHSAQQTHVIDMSEQPMVITGTQVLTVEASTAGNGYVTFDFEQA
jgi:hypothetical protein